MRKYFIFLLLSISLHLSAEQSNPIVIGNNRFTFITPGLVRLEYAENGQFLDDPTLFAHNRSVDFKDVQMEKQENGKYIFTTSKMRVEYTDTDAPFGKLNLRVYYSHNGNKEYWQPGMENEQNLKGALVTLDGIEQPIPLQDGLLSRDGWYMIDDSNKEVLKNDWVSPRHEGHIQDMYLFVYDHDFKSALKSLQTISGPVPMTRKYIHGSWYCRWWDYTSDDYRQIVREYKEHDFPIDILVFDMGWHTQKQATKGTGHAWSKGWTGYSWNRELIPDPGQLIKELNGDGIQVVLNEHPHDGIRDHEDAYPAFARAMGVDPSSGKNILFDAGSKKFMDNFMKYAHQESDSMGVAFWWLDWQQDYVYPLVRGTHMKHLPWLNRIYYNYSGKDSLRGSTFSRWAGWGDHRHPIQFSGDAVGNWDMLKFEIELTSTSGNAGCFFWAHDLGGFYEGKDPELYTRWTQFGLLNSSLRIHSVIDKDLDRRPWLWGAENEKAMKRIYHMRSQLMPYIYSSVRKCHTDMLPLNRGMYIEYSEDEKAYQNPQQFMFGDLLLGAPITTPGKGENKTAEQTVWLPAGDVWYNLFTGKKQAGGQTITESCDIYSFPLYIKGGYPIPMQPYTPRMASTDLTQLIVRCYPGTEGCNNSFSLYEDDGISKDYEKGGYALTKMEYQIQRGKTSLTIYPTEGRYRGQVKQRSYRIELPEVSPNQISVKVNGKKCSFMKDAGLNGIVVEIKAKDIRQKNSITIERL